MPIYLLLKTLKLVTIPTYTKKDGTVVQAHKRIIHVSTNEKLFSSQINSILEGRLKVATLGNTPRALRDAGFPFLPIRMTREVVFKLIGEHELAVVQIKRLPELLKNPEMVFRSDTREGSFVVVINELAPTRRGMEPVVVAIKPNGVIQRIVSNILTSAYGRNNFDRTVLRWIRKGYLVSDKEKAAAYLSTRGVQFPNVVQGTNSGTSEVHRH